MLTKKLTIFVISWCVGRKFLDPVIQYESLSKLIMKIRARFYRILWLQNYSHIGSVWIYLYTFIYINDDDYILNIKNHLVESVWACIKVSELVFEVCLYLYYNILDILLRAGGSERWYLDILVQRRHRDIYLPEKNWNHQVIYKNVQWKMTKFIKIIIWSVYIKSSESLKYCYPTF